jgi:hypothetical protein
MRIRLISVLLTFGIILSSIGFADLTVKLSNHDSMMPIFYQTFGTLATRNDFYVEVLAGPVGSTLIPATIAGTTETVIKLDQPGYFDGGIGVIPQYDGLHDNGPVDLQVRAWTGAPTYDQSVSTGMSLRWSQFTGSWDPNSGLPPSGPTLNMTASFVVGMPIPEPSVTALGIIGSLALWLVTNRSAEGGKYSSSRSRNYDW